MRDKEIHSLTLCSLEQHFTGCQHVFFVAAQTLMLYALLSILEAAPEVSLSIEAISIGGNNTVIAADGVCQSGRAA